MENESFLLTFSMTRKGVCVFLHEFSTWRVAQSDHFPLSAGAVLAVLQHARLFDTSQLNFALCARDGWLRSKHRVSIVKKKIGVKFKK